MRFTQWKTLAGKLKHVSVGASGIWGINSSGSLYRLDGKSWTQIHPSGWLTVSSGGKYIWATRTDRTVRRGDGDSWNVVPGGLIQIEASTGRNVLAIAPDYTIWRYTGTTWQRLDGHLRQVTSGISGVWAVGMSNHVYYRPQTYGDEANVGPNWQHVSANPQMKWVASGNDLVLAIDRSGNLHYRDGITVSQPTGTRWVKVGGTPQLKQIDVYNSVVVAVDMQDNILYNVIQY